jgi:hypothetical protein
MSAEAPDPFLTAWGLFRALETACEGTGLPDPTVDDLYEAAIDEIGGEGLDAGWHLVAARLRQPCSIMPPRSAATAAASPGSSGSSWGALRRSTSERRRVSPLRVVRRRRDKCSCGATPVKRLI